MGARLKVLTLVWIAGLLELTDSREEIQRVAQLAMKQRTALYENASLPSYFKAPVLTMASLYNRQIIASGLLGVASNHSLELSAMKAAGIQWKERKLASYRAVVTEYDLPVRLGIMKADYSHGSVTVKFTSPMDDNHFDILLKEVHLAAES